MTLRGLKVLRAVDWIAAEDTRRTRVLLQTFDIARPLIAHHAHNEHQEVPRLVSRLRGGEQGALVSDAGMPGISDPGYLLLRECRAAGVLVEVLPGPSAVITALVASGFPTEPFVYIGFIPATAGKRRSTIEELGHEGRTTVAFESPHRLRATLALCVELLPDRPIAIARELTKLHEEVRVGTATELLAATPETVRGEIALVFAPRGRQGRWTR